jgi:hypothetical protein
MTQQPGLGPRASGLGGAALAAVIAVLAAPELAAQGLDGLRRDAALVSSAELEARLASPARAVQLAAIAAAPAVPDAGELLDELAALASGWDRSLAAPAARAARTIARGLVGGIGGGPIGAEPARPGEPAVLDADALADALEVWRALAGRGDRWADVRVHALEIAVALTALRARTEVDVAPAYDLGALAVDPDPEVRRAAIELVPIAVPPAARPLLARTVVGDPATAVRLAAAQALCAELPRDAAVVLAALGTDGLDAVRALVAPPDHAPAPIAAAAAAIDAARCLAADDTPASRRALDGLRARLPRPLRATLAAVTDDARARGSRSP